MTQTKVEAPFVENNRPFRNLVINGDMQIAQRATSATTAVSNTYNTVDRWKPVFSMDGAFTMAQSALSAADIATTGHQYALDIQCSTADTSIAAGQFAWVAHLVEANNCRESLYGSDNAKSLTISFWVKSNLTGTTCGMVAKEDSTYTQAPFEFTINSANTWEHKTVTIPANAAIKASAGAISYDNGVGLYLAFHLAIGGNYDNGTNLTWATGGASYSTTNQLNFLSSTSNDLFITGVQMEFGGTATDFEHLPTDVQFNRCCRYYWKPVQGNASTNEYVALGDFYASAQVDIDFRHITPMRTQPTVEQGSGTDYFKYYYGNTANGTVDGAWTYWIGNEHISSLYATASDAVGTSNTGKACRVLTSTEASAYIALSAEL